MTPDEVDRLRHMRDAAVAAVTFSAGKSRASLDSDLMFQFAVIRAIEIIGEAAARLSDGTRASHPHVPWYTRGRHPLVGQYCMGVRAETSRNLSSMAGKKSDVFDGRVPFRLGISCYSGRRSMMFCQSGRSVALAINSRSSTICPIVNRIGWPQTNPAKDFPWRCQSSAPRLETDVKCEHHAAQGRRSTQEFFVAKVVAIVVLRSENVDPAAAQLLRDCGMHVNIHVKRNGHGLTTCPFGGLST